MQTKGILVAPKADYVLAQGRETDTIAEMKASGLDYFDVGVLFPADLTDHVRGCLPGSEVEGTLRLSDAFPAASAQIDHVLIKHVLMSTLRGSNSQEGVASPSALRLFRPFAGRHMTYIAIANQGDFDFLNGKQYRPDFVDFVRDMRRRCGMNPYKEGTTRIVSLRTLFQLVSWSSGYGIGIHGVRFGDPNIRPENIVLVRGFHTSIDKIMNPVTDKLLTGRRRVRLDD